MDEAPSLSISTLGEERKTEVIVAQVAAGLGVLFLGWAANALFHAVRIDDLRQRVATLEARKGETVTDPGTRTILRADGSATPCEGPLVLG